MVETGTNNINEISMITDEYMSLAKRINRDGNQARRDVIKIAGIFLKHEESKLPAGDLEFALDTESNIERWKSAISLANSNKLDAVSGLIINEALYLLEKPEQDRTKTDLEMAHGLFGMIGRMYEDSTRL